MLVSVCISAYDKPRHLERVLQSIFRQTVSHELEVIVVDDGSPGAETARMLQRFSSPIQQLHGGVTFLRVARAPSYRNPAVARNIAYRTAKGDVVICQSDDVEHVGNAVDGLVSELEPGTFALANVWNTDFDGRVVPCHGDWTELVGPSGRARRPIFFLGALRRKDIYRVGGNEERFTAPGKEDVWFGECLINGLGLRPKWLTSVRGNHLHHGRPSNLHVASRPSRDLYRELIREGRWLSSGAPWTF